MIFTMWTTDTFCSCGHAFVALWLCT